ncbi:MAG TPA: T9SS type A sorting domain-containing protein [Balneolales bacterium]|nr:T9SS type A sorting domain-containing protein [Balneolales bacterium]
MRKFTIISILLMTFLSITFNLKAQITITQSDVQNLIGQTFQVKTFASDSAKDFTSLAAQTGANQTFDFTGIASFDQAYNGSIQYISLPADIPGSTLPNFQNANFAIKINLTSTGQVTDSTAWVYQKVTKDSLNLAGIVFVTQSDFNNDGISPDTVTFSYNPCLTEAELPLTYQSAWKDTAKYSTIISDTVFSQTVQTDVVVDGYGMLKTPSGSTECLRLKRTTVIITNIGGNSSSATTGSIDFITKSGSAVAASIALDGNGNPLSAQYTELSSSTPIEAPPKVVDNYRLNQNYPNPFNPTTVISYTLNQAGPVTLQVYNALGQKIATLVNGTQSAGSHRITFIAKGLNSGVYFYKLKSGSFTQIKKMMLIK